MKSRFFSVKFMRLFLRKTGTYCGWHVFFFIFERLEICFKKLYRDTKAEIWVHVMDRFAYFYFCMHCRQKTKQKKKPQKTKKKCRWFCALHPLTCNSMVILHGLSTLYRCSLTTMTQDKPYHEKPLNRDCCNHKGSCTLFKPYLTIAAGISSSSFVRVSTRQ